MKTLDSLLTELSALQTNVDLEEVSDRANWTKDTRDQMLERTRQVSVSIADNALKVVSKILDKTDNGVSILKLFFLRELIAGEIEFLASLRNDLDTALISEAGQDIAESFDYDWINSNIKNKYLELHDLTDRIDKHLVLSKVEEL